MSNAATAAVIPSFCVRFPAAVTLLLAASVPGQVGCASTSVSVPPADRASAAGSSQSGRGDASSHEQAQTAGAGSNAKPRPSTTEPYAGVSVDPRDPRLRQLFTATESARGLAFKQPVPVIVQTADQIAAYLVEELDTQKLTTTQSLYEAIGLIEPGTNIRDLVQGVLQEQVVGYYDTTRKVLVIREDAQHSDTVPPHASKRRNSKTTYKTTAEGDTARWNEMEKNFILVHELTHALQDQHLALGEQADIERDTDADNAFRSLVEGDATLAMLGYLAHQMGRSLEELVELPSLIEQTVKTSSSLQADALSRAPAIVRETLLSAYTDGLLFCVQLFRAGGWPRVNAAHRHPPRSTEEILEPAASQATSHQSGHVATASEPASADEDRVRTLLGSHPLLLQPTIQDTLGQLEMRIFFEMGSPGPQAQRAARGWSYDRLAVYRHRVQAGAAGSPPPTGTGDSARRDAFVWYSVWDTQKDASEAEQASRRSLATLARKEPRSRLDVMRHDRMVVWGKNIDRAAWQSMRSTLERAHAAP